MSDYDRAVAAVLAQLALVADGAVIGLALAYAAVRTISKFTATSSALRKIEQAPSVSVSDLRSVISSDDDTSNNSDAAASTSGQFDDGGKLVIVRGTVEAKSALDNTWKSLRTNVLSSYESGDKGVILQRTQKYIYNDLRGFYGFTSDLRSLFPRSWKDEESSSTRTVPFILVDMQKGPPSEYVVVNLDGSRHPLPLTTVYHHLQPIPASPSTFLKAIFGYEYPVGLLDEEKILPLGKEITAVGICRLKYGAPEIKSCKDLPYFLSDMSKDQMVVDLAFKTKVLLWSGVVLGSMAIGVLGYAVVRNWNKFQEWKKRQTDQRNTSASDEADPQVAADEESGDVPDGELCVICLTRRRRSAFIPCGHLVCCQRCALSVEREMAPKCPLCRQAIRNSVRIYDS